MFGYLTKAERLQSSVRYAEARLDTDYSDEEVRRAIVHAREDIVMMCSYLHDVNKQLTWIRITLLIIGALVAALVFGRLG